MKWLRTKINKYLVMKKNSQRSFLGAMTSKVSLALDKDLVKASKCIQCQDFAATTFPSCKCHAVRCIQFSLQVSNNLFPFIFYFYSHQLGLLHGYQFFRPARHQWSIRAIKVLARFDWRPTWQISDASQMWRRTYLSPLQIWWSV